MGAIAQTQAAGRACGNGEGEESRICLVHLHPDVDVVKKPDSHRTRRSRERDYTEMSSGGSSWCRLP